MCSPRPNGYALLQIDQYFSRLSSHIKHSARGCLTFSQLRDAVESCFESKLSYEGEAIKPIFVKMENVFAMREWLLPHSRALSFLHGKHQFKFNRGEDGNCRFHWKEWDENEWTVEPFDLLYDIPNGQRGMTTLFLATHFTGMFVCMKREGNGIYSEPPKRIRPQYGHKFDIDQIAVTIRKAGHPKEDGVGLGVLTAQEEAEWTELLGAERKRQCYWESLPQTSSVLTCTHL